MTERNKEVGCPDAVLYDTKRSAWLEAQGWMVMRFWNNIVLEKRGRGHPP